MAISFIGSASASADTATIPAHEAGDTIVVFSYRSDSSTAPDLVAGFTNALSSGGNTNSSRLAWKTALSNAEVTGTWTNATHVIVHVYRGCDYMQPLGTPQPNSASSVTINYAAVDTVFDDSTSWVLGFAGHRTATNVEQAPTGLTFREDTGTGPEAASFDSNGTSTGFTTANITVDQNLGWRSQTVELKMRRPGPTVRSVGTVAAGTGAVSPALPAWVVTGDLMLMFCETGQSQAITVSGWTAAANSPVTEATGADDTTLSVFYRYAAGGDATTTSDSGDHNIAQIMAIADGPTSGDPFNVTANGTDGDLESSVNIPGATTTVDNCLVVAAVSVPFNGTSTAWFSAWANADLTNVQERMDNTTTNNDGGGFGVATGTRASAGTYGVTTATGIDTVNMAYWTGAVKPLPTTTEYERSAALGATGAVTVSGFMRERLRSSALAATGSIETSATFFSVFEAAAAVAATGAVTVAGFLREHLRSAAVAATGLISTVGINVNVQEREPPAVDRTTWSSNSDDTGGWTSDNSDPAEWSQE